MGSTLPSEEPYGFIFPRTHFASAEVTNMDRKAYTDCRHEHCVAGLGKSALLPAGLAIP